jgi:hypothetical protein
MNATEPTPLQRQAQRNGNGPRVPRSRPLTAEHEAVAEVACDIIRYRTASPSIGKRRGKPLSEAYERTAALRQHEYVATHRGVA